jgi:hypothetical protein
MGKGDHHRNWRGHSHGVITGCDGVTLNPESRPWSELSDPQTVKTQLDAKERELSSISRFLAASGRQPVF